MNTPPTTDSVDGDRGNMGGLARSVTPKVKLNQVVHLNAGGTK